MESVEDIVIGHGDFRSVNVMGIVKIGVVNFIAVKEIIGCLLYTSDAADEEYLVELGGGGGGW